MKKLNKTLSIILAITMVMSIIPLTASAVEPTSGTCGENITWEFDVATRILTISGTGNMNDYLKSNRPSFETYKSQIETVIINDGVNQIGTCAFYNYTNLKNVTISDGVKAIGTSAFYGCTNLANITIPDSVTLIGYSAFVNTAYYNNESNWESNVLYIGNHLVGAKPSISGDYEIKAGTKTIADLAFINCKNLTNITIPNSVITLGENPFSGCKNLTNITIPDSVSSIGNEIFNACEKLESITVDNKNQFYTDVDGVLFNKDRTVLIKYPEGNKTNSEYEIPDSVLTIEAWAFRHCYNLEKVTIPDSVSKIGNNAFYYCRYLTDVKIGNGVKEISEEMFGVCDSLVTVTIPDNVVTIGERAFSECYNITNVIIGKNLTSISWAAFEECTNIKDVYYSGTQNQWNSIAIDGCNDELIYATIHYNSTGPHTHDYESAITPPTCTEQGYTTYTCECGDSYVDDYVGALGHIDNDNNNCCDKCSKYILPTSGTHGDNLIWTYTPETFTLNISGIGSMEGDLSTDYPWSTYATNIENVVIESGVTSIASNAFETDAFTPYNIKNVEIADTVTKIGSQAFDNCDNLTSIIIPVSVTTIYPTAFSDCDGLKDVYYLGTQQQWNKLTISVVAGAVFNNATIHFLGEETHDCSYNAVVTPPTCTEQGYTTYTCVCGDSYVDDYVNATGHSHTSEVTTPATHTETGVMTYTCDCGDTYTETIEKLEKHNYDAVVTAPTCTAQGYTTYTCECGDTYVDDYVDALGHIEETVPAVAPTCTETGLTAGANCSVCGETLTEQKELPANGHSPANAVEENYVAPTCTENGSKDVVVYCSICDEEISRETEIIDETDHADNDEDGCCDTCNEQLEDNNDSQISIISLIVKIIKFLLSFFGIN